IAGTARTCASRPSGISRTAITSSSGASSFASRSPPTDGPREAGAPLPMANRLAREASPYLRQHGENPVDWYPWGPEALEKAKREDKPILLSIGYSACHWCHVM